MSRRKREPKKPINREPSQQLKIGARDVPKEKCSGDVVKASRTFPKTGAGLLILTSILEYILRIIPERKVCLGFDHYL